MDLVTTVSPQHFFKGKTVGTVKTFESHTVGLQLKPNPILPNLS
jgi:hypothetical protein